MFPSLMPNGVRCSLDRLLVYCEDHNWMGYDPFDGLNSQIFQSLPLLKNCLFTRMLFLQFNKRSLVNFRHFLGIPKERNPKGIGLFLSAFTDLYGKSRKAAYLHFIRKFMEWLKQDASLGFQGFCWGYNFDWQSRAFFLPRKTPTIVNTSIIGCAFLKAYPILKDEECLHIARSCCDFILKDLHRIEGDDILCFSYSPLDRYFVHNATALAASLFAETSQYTQETSLKRIAKKCIQYVARHQKKDGSWPYGEDAIARKTGTDSFHTGFILESLKRYMDATGDEEYVEIIKKGLRFYQDNFFVHGGIPKYFPDKIYPLDIHCASQGVITLTGLKDMGADQALVKEIIFWMIKYMQSKKGFFYYQKGRFYTNKISYMRWSQAWAFLALAKYICANNPS